MKPEDIIRAQRKFFNSNQTRDLSFRKQQLKKLKELLSAHEDFLCNAVYEDFGKSKFETIMTELSLIQHELKLALRHLKKWSRPKRVRTGMVNFPARSYILPEPLGNCLIIGAWNYPYQLSLIPAISALAAGNTVLLKPSELPQNASAVMAKMINENFDPGYFHVLEGGVAITSRILEHRFDKIFFTGSTRVGKIIYQAAAKQLTPVTLELGGKSPCFVLRDADLKMSVRRMVWGKLLNAGQTCVAPDYVLVDKLIETPFLEALKEEIEKQYSAASKKNFPRIINLRNFDRLERLIEEDKVYCGAPPEREKKHLPPTVLAGVSPEDEIMDEEIFGPVLPVLAYENLDSAIRLVKQRPKPLSCYVYGKNRAQINRIIKGISFGGGAVNETLMQLTNSALPFGGVGMSGIGSYHGEAGFRCFSHYKSILDKPTWFELPIKYPPYTDFKLKLIRWLME